MASSIPIKYKFLIRTIGPVIEFLKSTTTPGQSGDGCDGYERSTPHSSNL